MKLNCILLFTFAFIPLHNVKAAAPPPPATPPPSPPIQLWNHILAISYGYGLRSANRKRFKHPLPPQKAVFTLHGLWPNVIPPTKRLPRPISMAKSTYCYPSSLSAAEIQSVMGPLTSDWPDLYNYGSTTDYLKFWEKEWKKQGTCSKFSKLLYFQKTLHLFKLLDLNLIVGSGGALAPDDHKIYYENDVLKAFEKHKPYLICAGSKGNTVLTELYFCLDSQASSFANCSTFYRTNSNNCGNGFKLKAT